MIASATPNIAATWMPSTKAVRAAVANTPAAPADSLSAACSAPASDEPAASRADRR